MAALLFPTPTQLQNLASPSTDNDGATKKYVDDSISNLIDGAPSALNTLKELSTALNSDASFSSTITGLINTKANTSALSNIAFSGSYNDLTNLPTSVTATWKTWNVLGQDPLIAAGDDTIEFVAGDGIEISTNSTTKKITFSGTQYLEIDGGYASTIYTAEITVDGGGA
jgi:hypothetical protein